MDQHATTSSIMGVPDWAFGPGQEGWFYNSDSRLILLEGTDRGPLLARYQGADPPDPRRHKFLVSFEKSYPVYEKSRAPSEAPADVCAIAWPVEKTRDPRTSVTSGATGDAVSGKGEGEPKTLITPESGHDKTMRDLSGMQLTPARADIYADGGGLAVDAAGVHIEGGFEQPTTQKKGVMRESPLFGLVPKTIVTFFASDYLPDIKLILKLKKYADIIRRMPKLYQAIRRIANDLGADLAADPIGEPPGVDDPIGTRQEEREYERSGFNRILPND